MPVVDRREFGGRFTVRENAQRLANYRYFEIQMMEMIGGWCHTTPAINCKAVFGYHAYDHAQAADLLNERIAHLRSSRNRQEAANDEIAHLCEQIWNLTSTVERLVALYRVLEPHLVSAYVYHADATDPLADAPTMRLLRQLAATGQSHIAWGQAVLESLTRSPDDRKRALELQSDLEARLVDAGGVTGQGIEAHWLAFHSVKADQKPPPRPKVGKKGYSFVKRCPDIPHNLIEAPFWFTDNREDFDKYDAQDEWSLEGFRDKFHNLIYGEIETTDRMGKMLAEFPELPWEMRMDLAHQMWDEARHIEIVTKMCEEELGAELGYAPFPTNWWWIQNQRDPLQRIAVNNAWGEANLMGLLRIWRAHAEERGLTRIAELCDYLQADELSHVQLATRWVRELTKDDPVRFSELVRWARATVVRVSTVYDPDGAPDPSTIHFSYLHGSEEFENLPTPGKIIGE
jgi:hypothetical protein